MPLSDAGSLAVDDDAAMARSIDHHHRATTEDRRFLDSLIFWRALYAARGPRDRDPVVDLDAAVADAQRHLLQLESAARP